MARSRRGACPLAGALLAAAGLLRRAGAAAAPGCTAGAGGGDGGASCGAAPNRIVRENALEGADSSEWDINGAGDPTIQGFATDVSVAAGEEIRFKVRTAASSYRLDIYRLGYYSGRGARRVATVAPSASLPQTQPECAFDEATLLVDCAAWEVSAVWEVPQDAVSGVYFARLVRTDPVDPDFPPWRADGSPVLSDPKFERAGWDPRLPPLMDMGTHAYGGMGQAARQNALKEPRASHIYFVVRDEEHTSSILVQTAETTWQAYNCWGSTNTYGVPCDSAALHAGSPSPPNRSRRAYKTSFNRPFATRSYRATNMLFNSEYAFIRWVERNGYDVSYWSGTDADRFGERLADPRLSRHRVYVSLGHDEYWSGRQRHFVTMARDRGVSLCFLSGNEVYWRIRWEPDGTGESYRTMVVYKDTQSVSKLDPVDGEWTGTFRDGRPVNPLGPQPENALTGTIFTVNAWRNDLLEVPAEYGLHRFWRNTSVARLPPGETLVVPVPGLLGHEWDEDIDNGFRPAGLQHLSSTTVENVQYIQDEGATYDTGTGTHHLTLYRHANGALVFGAGTVQWAWGLDGHHDLVTGSDYGLGKQCYSLRVGMDQLVRDGNLDIQQAMANVLADMGVLPATLQPGLVLPSASGDTAPPSLQIDSLRVVPATESSGSPGAVLEGVAEDAPPGIVAAVEVSEDGGQTWHPASTLDRRSGRFTYSLREGGSQREALQFRLADDSGNLGVHVPQGLAL